MTATILIIFSNSSQFEEYDGFVEVLSFAAVASPVLLWIDRFNTDTKGPFFYLSLVKIELFYFSGVPGISRF